MAVTFNMTAVTDGFPFTLPSSRLISLLKSSCCARNPAAAPWHVRCDYIFLTEPESCRFSCGSGAVRANGNAEQPAGKTKGAVGKDKQVLRKALSTRVSREWSIAMLGTVLIVILVLLLVGALPTWPHSKSWGYYPSGGLGLILLILLILLLLGHI